MTCWTIPVSDKFVIVVLAKIRHIRTNTTIIEKISDSSLNIPIYLPLLLIAYKAYKGLRAPLEVYSSIIWNNISREKLST